MNLNQESKESNANEVRQLEKAIKLWKRFYPIGFKEEFVNLLHLSWPTILTSFFRFFTLTVSIIMCGHLDKIHLDTAALGNSIINILGLAINLGFSTACDTLFGQTFGSKNKVYVGILLQRAFVVGMPVMVVVSYIFLNVEPILIATGQDEEIASMTASFVKIFIPGLYSDMGFIILCRYLQNQMIVYPPMICGALAMTFNAISQYIAIYVFEQDYRASAICQSATFVLLFSLQVAYIVIFKPYKQTWSDFEGWSFYKPLENIRHFFVLGITGILLVSLEEWTYEIGTFIAGTLGPVELGAQGIIFQLISMVFMIPIGLATSVSIRVSNHLGAGNPENARNVYFVALLVITVTGFVVVLLLRVFSRQLSMLFSTDKLIVDRSTEVLNIISYFQFFEGLLCVTSGVIRGFGQQVIGTFMMLLGYYGVSIPLILILIFSTNMGILAIWVSTGVGCILVAAMNSIFIYFSDWEKQSQLAIIRAEERGDAEVIDESQIVESDNETKPICESKLPLLSHEIEPLISKGTNRIRNQPNYSADLRPVKRSTYNRRQKSTNIYSVGQRSFHMSDGLEFYEFFKKSTSGMGSQMQDKEKNENPESSEPHSSLIIKFLLIFVPILILLMLSIYLSNTRILYAIFGICEFSHRNNTCVS